MTGCGGRWIAHERGAHDILGARPDAAPSTARCGSVAPAPPGHAPQVEVISSVLKRVNGVLVWRDPATDAPPRWQCPVCTWWRDWGETCRCGRTAPAEAA